MFESEAMEPIDLDTQLKTEAEPEARSYSVDEAMDGIEPELAGRLAILNGAPTDTVEMALAMLPFGWRLALGSYGVISETEAASGTRSVRLTDFGRAVLNESAARLLAAAQESTPGHEELQARAAELRRQLAGVTMVEAVHVGDE